MWVLITLGCCCQHFPKQVLFSLARIDKNTFRYCRSQEENSTSLLVRAINCSTESFLRKYFFSRILFFDCSLTSSSSSFHIQNSAVIHEFSHWMSSLPHKKPVSAMKTNQPQALHALEAWFSQQLSTQDSRCNRQMPHCLEISLCVTVKCPDWYLLISSAAPALLALSVSYLRSSSDFCSSSGFWQRIQSMQSSSCDRPVSSRSEGEINVYDKLIKSVARHP